MWAQVGWMPKCIHEKNLSYSVTHLENMDKDGAGNTEVRGDPSSGIQCHFGKNLFVHSFIHQLLLEHLLHEGPKFSTWDILLLALALAHLLKIQDAYTEFNGLEPFQEKFQELFFQIVANE